MSTTTIQVPVNTMLADLDESLKTLLKRDLDRHGFDGVEIEFDAPDKEWAASLSSPAVNLFLYDIREAKELRPIDWEERIRDGRTFDLRPPLRIDAIYAVTAWTRDVQDEHRLLSQVMAVLYAFPTLPADVLTASLANGSQRYPLKTRTAQERHEDASDFWTAVGGQYKASFNYRRDAVVRGGRLARARARGADGDDAPLRPRLARGDAHRDAPERRHRRRRRRHGRPERLGAPAGDRPARRDRRRRPLPLRPPQARAATPSPRAAPTARRPRPSSPSRARAPSSGLGAKRPLTNASH